VKALTIKQPWASAIFALGKDIENRSWRTPYRGPLLIHAALHDDEAGWDWLLVQGLPDLGIVPRGGFIGVVKLVDVITDDSSYWARPGACHWWLARPRRIEFTEARGMPGLWTPRELPKGVK
jgi:hypothetical protein